MVDVALVADQMLVVVDAVEEFTRAVGEVAEEIARLLARQHPATHALQPLEHVEQLASHDGLENGAVVFDDRLAARVRTRLEVEQNRLEHFLENWPVQQAVDVAPRSWDQTNRSHVLGRRCCCCCCRFVLAAAGVRVKLVVALVGLFRTPDSFFGTLWEARIRAAFFRWLFGLNVL